MNGILIVDKPAGYTSFDVVACLRKVFQQKKIGHAGTLDPEARGVLPVFLGNATRLTEFFIDHEKCYRAEMTFGFSSDTEDIWGTLTETGFSAEEATVRNAILSFVGPYDQIPPMYSAKKVNGEKLCNLARRGITVERKPEHVEIYEISDLEIALPKASFTVRCSKGTYIRTLITDIAESIGEHAVMSGLVRLQHGIFTLSDAHPLKEIQEAKDEAELQAMVLPVDTLLAAYPEIQVSGEEEARLYNGNILPLTDETTQLIDGSFIRVYDSCHAFTALYRKEAEGLKAAKMFLPTEKTS